MPLLAPRSSGVDISPDGQIANVDTVIPDAQQQQSHVDNDQAAQQQQQQTDNQPDNNQDQQQQADDIDLISFDAFKAAKSLEIADKPVEQKQQDKEAEGKEQVQQQQQQQQNDTQEDLDKPQQPVIKKQDKKANLPDNRDYTGIAADMVPHFKRMSNESFAAIKPLLLSQQEAIKNKDTEISNLKQGKVIIPDNYYEHERAYMLTPDFESALQNVNEADIVYKHWEQQLNAIREGAKTFKTLVRNQQGQLAYGADLPADASAETKLMSLFNSAHNQLLTYNGKLAAVQESFKGNYTQAKQWVENMNNNTFSAFKDDKQPLAIAAKEYVNKTLPAAFRHNPLAGTLARSLITTAEMYKMLVQAKQLLESKGLLKNGKVANGQQAQAQVKTNRQPTQNDISSDAGAGNANGSEVTMDDFNRVKGI